MVIDDQDNIHMCLKSLLGNLDKFEITIVSHLNEIEAYRDFLTRNLSLSDKSIDVIILDNNLGKFDGPFICSQVIFLFRWNQILETFNLLTLTSSLIVQTVKRMKFRNFWMLEQTHLKRSHYQIRDWKRFLEKFKNICQD